MSYSIETKYLKCECQIKNTDIVTLDAAHISGDNVAKSFYSTLKYSNWKVMICYNLVFNFKIFCHNYGSILSLILFIIYLLFMIYYSCKEISPLKISISKIIFKDTDIENRNNLDFKQKNKVSPKKMKVKEKNRPKKTNTKRIKEDIDDTPKHTEEFEFIENDTKRKKIKNKTNNKKKRNSKIKRKSQKGKKNLDIQIMNINIENINEIKTRESINKLQNYEKYLNKNLDNFELNNLDYEEASELDNRGFCRTYWSVLLREHSALLTFVAWHDYNLFYVKIERFLILFCTDMTMNGLFFSDESMHNLYVNNGEYSFVQQLPQILYSLIVGHILEVILCYLSMTDTAIYKIKGLPRNGQNSEKILDIMDCMKRKLVIFFVFTFFLFLFYWYFISAFCAVYQNTQKIFLRDSITSFITSMIDPFIIYGLTMILRLISLSKCCKKKCSCIYRISDLIPIF